MPRIKLRVTSTHHIAVAVQSSLDAIWNDIVLGLGSGQRFKEQGYRVVPLDGDPRAYLGGYRMWREAADDPDERITFISEQDNAARRLSLCAYYLGAHARNTVVNATYSAIWNDQGNWYQIDCHGTEDLDIRKDASAADVARVMEQSKQEMAQYLKAALEARKATLEAARPPEQAR